MLLKLKVEQILFTPRSFFDWLFVIFLSPLSLIYCFIVFVRAIFFHFLKKNINPEKIKIIGVGNLTLGGNGKTPLIIKIIESIYEFEKNKKIAILLRGYGRKSRGTLVVSHDKKILENIDNSGDEATLFAKKLAHLNVSVIVSENRQKGIKKALDLNIDTLFLDDSYSKHYISKKEILILDNTQKLNKLCLPAGSYREKLWFFKKNKNLITVQENIDFTRRVKLSSNINLEQQIILITAISKPHRLDKYLEKYKKNIINKYYFSDHHNFTQSDILYILESQNSNIRTILTTEKDLVKLEKLNIKNIKFITLELDIDFENSRILDFVKNN
jgi:tetraacyldisaccharide 4'-kinase